MNCPCEDFDIQKYKDMPYQQTPCSKCSLTKQTYRTNKHIQLYTTDGAQQDQALAVACQTIPQQELLPDNISPQIIKLITEACQQNMLVTLSNVVLKLCVMSKEYPAMFQILILKMQHPSMSYYQIGRNMIPVCSKQNVLYHLQHAVQLFPDLYKAIITDTRFSAGKNAIKKVFDLIQKDEETSRVKKLIYAQSSINTAQSMQQLKKIFAMPYKVQTINVYDKLPQKPVPPRKLKKANASDN